MKSTAIPMVGIFMIVQLLMAGAIYGQRNEHKLISLDLKNVSLVTLFNAIEAKAGLTIMYEDTRETESQTISISVKNKSVATILDSLLKGKSLKWSIRNTVIRIESMPKGESVTTEPGYLLPPPIDVRGKVMNDKREPVAGATIVVKGTTKATSTDENGNFTLTGIDGKSILLVTGINIETYEVPVNQQTIVSIAVRQKVSELDQTIVIAYGTTTKRFNTGSVGKLTAEEISKQPVSNPLSALQGRIAGVEVTQNNGIPGSAVKVLIRGQSSLLNGSDPLYIIDGVPFAAAGQSINQFASVLQILNGSSTIGQAISPFNSINPEDIESIEVLKDADATAIYGSRGANGVVLITTKKARAGKTKFNATINSGVSSVGKLVKKMNADQYVKLRRDAFANDGITPNKTNAYDLLIWDTTRSTDWDKYLYGNQANVLDAYTSLSGGSSSTQFYMGTGFRKENTIFSKSFQDKKMSFKANLTHQLPDQKLTVNVSLLFSTGNNELPQALNSILPPNAPELYDSIGRLNWGPPGGGFDNPVAILYRRTQVKTDNMQAGLQLKYKIIKGLSASANIGYNVFNSNETSITPIASINPNTTANLLGSARFGTVNLKSLIIESQIEYSRLFLGGKLNVLAGGTWQRTENYNSYISATGYTNDNLLLSLDAAPTIAGKGNGHSFYKYAAAFGRVNYNFRDKYLINLSARRDGSSKFGYNKRYANFGAIGGAWLFTNEGFIKKAIPFLSFGKLRSSYGITGNDQIGDYNFLDKWSAINPYQGGISLEPRALFNGDYTWERNKKFEAAVELGAWKDRILFSIAFYKNRIDNQLAQYRLPSQTGYGSVLRNFPAVFQNTGFEFSAGIDIIKNSSLQWTLSGNISFPKNKLLSFPGLASSSYVSKYVVGKSINIIRGYKSLGVDPATGLFEFLDINKDGALTPAKDFTQIGTREPKYFGGLRSVLKYRGIELELFFEGKNQVGLSYLSSVYFSASLSPGFIYSHAAAAGNYWKTPGQLAEIQKVTASSASEAYKRINFFRNSDAIYTDASYIKLKTLAVSYNFSRLFPGLFRENMLRVYMNAQNLFTITKYKYSDPETQNLRGIPPLRTITAGLQVTL